MIFRTIKNGGQKDDNWKLKMLQKLFIIFRATISLLFGIKLKDEIRERYDYDPVVVCTYGLEKYDKNDYSLSPCLEWMSVIISVRKYLGYFELQDGSC